MPNMYSSRSRLKMMSPHISAWSHDGWMTFVWHQLLSACKSLSPCSRMFVGAYMFIYICRFIAKIHIQVDFSPIFSHCNLEPSWCILQISHCSRKTLSCGNCAACYYCYSVPTIAPSLVVKLMSSSYLLLPHTHHLVINFMSSVYL